MFGHTWKDFPPYLEYNYKYGETCYIRIVESYVCICCKKRVDEVIGNRTRCKVVKNKVAPPFREAEFDIMYGSGISKEGELLDIATKKDIISKSGTWFNYGEIRLGQGRDNAKEYLKNDPNLMKEISEKVLGSIAKHNPKLEKEQQKNELETTGNNVKKEKK